MFITKGMKDDRISEGALICAIALFIAGMATVLGLSLSHTTYSDTVADGSLAFWAITATIAAFIILIGVFGIIFWDEETRKNGFIYTSFGAFMVFSLFYVGGGLIAGIIPIVPFLVGTFIFSEIMFWTEKEKPDKKDGIKTFTVKRKIENLVEAGMFVGIFFEGLYVVKNYFGLLVDYTTMAIYGVSIISLVIIAVWGYIELNAQKYRKGLYEQKDKRKKI